MIHDLNERTKTIFRYIVDSYLETGEPVGSRAVSRGAMMGLSPASIRNVMADLEDAGLLYAPHTSAGRMPTESGIRLYIDGLMQIGDLTAEERAHIEAACRAEERPIESVLNQAAGLLSGLSSCAGLVVAPPGEGALKQIQFVPLSPRRILAVLVFESGLVENRVFTAAQDTPATALMMAQNYINAKLVGRTLAEAETLIRREIAERRTQLDAITTALVEKGLALAPGAGIANGGGRIIIRGQSSLLKDLKALEDLERARALLAQLEHEETMLEVLGMVGRAEGVQIFIGAENPIFAQSGWSMIVAPYRDSQARVVGAIGVIGPTRLDYDRIIPMVDYTSRIVAKLVDI